MNFDSSVGWPKLQSTYMDKIMESDGVDEDYFTPLSSTKLENIFSKSRDDEAENESLKYIPPKPPVSKQVVKATECLIACAFLAYEWNSNAYVEKGKLGFAIIKYLKNLNHDIVLYDSNKTTLSKTTISSKTQITLKNNLYISFYDNFNKFWCIYGSEKEIFKVVETLKSLNVVLNYSHTDKDFPNPGIPVKEILNPDKAECNIASQNVAQDFSDTDSSLQEKTKDAILTRMANMGQSVLPPCVMSPEKASESSDANEGLSPKAVRKKSIKNNAKRINSKPESHIFNEHKTMTPLTVTDVAKSSEKLYTMVNGTFLPIANSDNELKFFMTEQRVSSSEIRINVSRLNDKIDQVLDTVQGNRNKKTLSSNCSLQFEVMQKLILEYENKIKRYEHIIESNKLHADKSQQCDVEYYKAQVLQLEKKLNKKDEEIAALTKRLQSISKNESEM